MTENNHNINKLLSKDECIRIALNAFYDNNNNNNNDNSNNNNENLIKSIDYHCQEITSEDTVGFLGEYYKLIIQINGECNKIKQFFVKTLPIHKNEERKMLQESGILKKETTLYRTLLKDLSLYSKTKWLPKFYYATDNLIVLEDLIEIGYFLIPERNDYSEKHLKACLQSLAALHASSIAYEEEHNCKINELYETLLFETSVAKDNDWFLAGLNSLQAAALHHPKYQSKKYQKFISNEFLKKLEPVYEMVNSSKTYRNVLCHRDPWGRNMFFKYDRSTSNQKDNLSCVLVDFQICRYSPPAIDVLFCIYLNITYKLRQRIFHQSLKWYYKYLSHELNQLKIDINNHILEDEFLKCCDEFKLWPLTYNAIASTIISLPKGVLNDLRINDPKEYQNFALGDRSKIVLKYLKTDENFRNCLFQVIEELMDVIVK